MRLEEFIQQHRVHRIVAHAVDLTFAVAHYEIGVHFRDFFGDQTKLRRRFSVALVMESDRFERENGFTVFVHRLHVLFEPRRGSDRAELPVAIDHNRVPDHGGAADAGDESSGVSACRADPNCVVVARNAVVADCDVVRSVNVNATATSYSNIVYFQLC
jgi:hypothetical protein